RLVAPRFVGREQVDEQRRQAGLVQRVGDLPVARALAAAAAAVCEDDDAGGAVGHGEVAFKRRRGRVDEDGFVSERREQGHRIVAVMVQVGASGEAPGAAGEAARAASRRASTSSSDVCSKWSYQAPTATSRSGRTT